MGKPEVAKRVPCSTIYSAQHHHFSQHSTGRCVVLWSWASVPAPVPLSFYWPRWSLQGHQAEIGDLERPLPSPWAAGAPRPQLMDWWWILGFWPRYSKYLRMMDSKMIYISGSKWYDHVWSTVSEKIYERNPFRHGPKHDSQESVDNLFGALPIISPYPTSIHRADGSSRYIVSQNLGKIILFNEDSTFQDCQETKKEPKCIQMSSNVLIVSCILMPILWLLNSNVVFCWALKYLRGSIRISIRKSLLGIFLWPDMGLRGLFVVPMSQVCSWLFIGSSSCWFMKMRDDSWISMTRPASWWSDWVTATQICFDSLFLTWVSAFWTYWLVEFGIRIQELLMILVNSVSPMVNPPQHLPRPAAKFLPQQWGS